MSTTDTAESEDASSMSTDTAGSDDFSSMSDVFTAIIVPLFPEDADEVTLQDFASEFGLHPVSVEVLLYKSGMFSYSSYNEAMNDLKTIGAARGSNGLMMGKIDTLTRPGTEATEKDVPKNIKRRGKGMTKFWIGVLSAKVAELGGTADEILKAAELDEEMIPGEVYVLISEAKGTVPQLIRAVDLEIKLLEINVTPGSLFEAVANAGGTAEQLIKALEREIEQVSESLEQAREEEKRTKEQAQLMRSRLFGQSGRKRQRTQ